MGIIANLGIYSTFGNVKPLFMEELLLIGGGVALLYFFGKGVALSNLHFLVNGSTIDISNPLRPVINLSVLVQNPTSGQLTLNSLAGNFSVNGAPTGNVSYFTPTVILPNAQTQIILNLSVSDVSLIADLVNYINGGGGSIVVTVNATANINNVPAPISLSFMPVGN